MCGKQKIFSAETQFTVGLDENINKKLITSLQRMRHGHPETMSTHYRTPYSGTIHYVFVRMCEICERTSDRSKNSFSELLFLLFFLSFRTTF